MLGSVFEGAEWQEAWAQDSAGAGQSCCRSGSSRATGETLGLLTGRAKLSVGDRIAVGKAASKKTVLELTIRAGE